MASYTYEFIDLGDEHSLGCKCCRFDKGIDLPVPMKLSREEMAKLARAFSISIFKDWSKLNAILKRFEAIIHKRWLKKSPKQRRDILLNAWPEMPTTHRPDFAGFRKVKKNTPRSHTLPSSALLWPYIDVEDLVQRHHLLLFINSRGRNPPGIFSHVDILSAHLGEGWDQDDDKADFCMELYGACGPATYGKLRSEEEMCTFDGTQKMIQTPSRGLLLLEIQTRIYGFVLSCAKLILHDIAPHQYFLAPHQPTPSIPDGDSREWPSLAAHALEVTYKAPQAMDISRLAMMAGARRAAAEDHLWLLTEDPGYFSDSLKEWKEHSKETMQHSCSRCWRHVGERMIGDAFVLFIIWHWIHRQLTLMRPFEEQLRRANYKKLRLARQDEKLWLEFCNVVQTMEIFPIAVLSTGLKASPRLRNIYFTRESIRHGNPQLKEVPEKHTDAEKRVDLLFHAIINDERRELHTLNHLVQETQHMLDTDPEANVLIDSWLSSIFADLAMLSELNIRVECLDPWSTGWKRCDLLHSKAALKPMEDILALETKLRTGLSKAFSNGQVLDECHAMDILLDGKFDYPAAKRQTKENVEKMRFAEMLLDGVWEEIERCVLETTNINITKVIKNRLFEPRMKYRTQDYTPPLITPTKAPVLVERSVNVPRFGEGTNTASVVTPAKEKTKIKTRGVADSPSQDKDRASSSQEPDTPSPVGTATVPKRAYKVLAALFPPPGTASHQRTEIAWEELLQAMNTIGFQPMKLYGSVWIFMPRHSEGKVERRGEGQVVMNGECMVEAKRSIQFHEPKEVRKGSKIPASMVRTFGRRMKHAFGWWDGMFVSE